MKDNNKYCPICGNGFYVKPCQFERRNYCSKACMAIGYKTRLQGITNPNHKNAGIRICQFCNAEYQHYSKVRKFCSQTCSSRDSRGKPKSKQKIIKISIPREIKKCLNCKENLPHKRATICKRCYTIKQRENQVTIVCQICKTSRKVKTSSVQKFCSMRCVNLNKRESQKGENSHFWQGGKATETIKQRGSAEYREWRSKVFARDNWTCVFCGQRGGTINADHIKPFSTYPELRFDLRNGRTLCLKCHIKTPTYGRKANYFQP